MGVVIYLELSLSRVQLRLLETQEIEMLGNCFDEEIAKLSQICNYFATVPIYRISDNFTEDSHHDMQRTIDRIEAVKTISEQIKTIAVKNSAGEYLFGGLSFYQTDMARHISFGKFNNNELRYVYLPDKNEELFLRYSNSNQAAGQLNQVLVGINSNILSETIMQQRNNGRIELITDGSGKVMLSKRSSEIGRSIAEISGVDLPLKEITAKKYKSFNTKKYVSVKKLKNYDLYAISAIDVSFYSITIWQNVLIGVCLCILFFVLTAVTVGIIVNIHYKPIKKIYGLVGSPVNTGSSNTEDEFEFIYNNMHRLNKENTDLHDKVLSSYYELKTQQLIARQTQICPHFISNTLSAINWIAIDKLGPRNNSISKIVKNLFSLLQSSLETGNVLTSIRKETELTIKYIEIAQIRYEDMFRVEWEVDEKLMAHSILKLSLQPLVENIIGHAFVDISKSYVIHISIKCKDELICVCVSDNGVGIEQDKLSEIIAHANDFENRPSGHIGLKNVNHRLKLLYGENYGLIIRSEAGRGTSCTFCFPYTTEFPNRPAR